MIMINAAADNVTGYFFVLNHSMAVTRVAASILLFLVWTVFLILELQFQSFL